MNTESESLPSFLALSHSERRQIAEILDRRSNDIASFKSDLERKTKTELDGFPGSVEMALTREIHRLRRLSEKVKPTEPEVEDEE